MFCRGDSDGVFVGLSMCRSVSLRLSSLGRASTAGGVRPGLGFRYERSSVRRQSGGTPPIRRCDPWELGPRGY